MKMTLIWKAALAVLILTVSLFTSKVQSEVSVPPADGWPGQQLAFASMLFQQVCAESQTQENILVSPMSLYRVLGLLALGSDGETKKEFQSAMFWTGTDADWINKMASVYQNLDQSSEVSTAVGLWIQKDFLVEQEYKDKINGISTLDIQNVDLINDPRAAEEINNWIEQQTEGRITDMIDSIDPETRLIIADTMVFTGEWQNQFDERRTCDGDFTNVNGEKVTCLFMTQRGLNVPYFKDDKIAYAEIPYQDGRFSMVFVVPDKYEDYLEVEKNLTAAQLVDWHGKARNAEIDLLLPKFSLETKSNMTSALKRLNVIRAFSPGAANFKPMNKENLIYLSSLDQGNFLEVDEKGTRAAAATVAGMTRGAIPSPVPRLYIDRPFLFFIRQNEDSMILMMGRFVNP